MYLENEPTLHLNRKLDGSEILYGYISKYVYRTFPARIRTHGFQPVAETLH